MKICETATEYKAPLVFPTNSTFRLLSYSSLVLGGKLTRRYKISAGVIPSLNDAEKMPLTVGQFCGYLEITRNVLDRWF
jgi:hypothetical protein